MFAVMMFTIGVIGIFYRWASKITEAIFNENDERVGWEGWGVPHS